MTKSVADLMFERRKRIYKAQEEMRNQEFIENTKEQVSKMMRRMYLIAAHQLEHGVDITKTIIADPHVDDYSTVKRSWKERLFTLPFRPFTKTKCVYSPVLYALADGTLVCSPTTKAKIEAELND